MEVSFIHDNISIKILILFILRRIPEGIDRDQLAELTMCDAGITYFDFTECLGELIQTGHVETDGLLYKVTDKGRRNGEITEPSIPYTVRMKAEKATLALAASLQRSVMIKAEHTPKRGGGYRVNLAVLDGTDPMMKIELSVRNEMQAIRIEKKFTDKAEESYTRFMDYLLAD